MTTPTLDAATHRAVADLRAIREQWGDLLHAIDTPPAQEWPPRETRGFLDHAAADDKPTGPTIGRAPLVLREHPAPLNLDALDAALDAERGLFDLADQLAEQVQRPVRRVPHPDRRRRAVVDGRDRDDPARWHYASQTAPGSRAHGLHWAAVWIEGRLVGDDLGDGLFTLPTPRMLAHAASTTAHARRQVERALGRDGRTLDLDRPCPWCGGDLTGRAAPGGEPSVTCGTGEACGAPVLLDGRGRRAWSGADLVGLYVAIEAAGRRTGNGR